MNTEQLGRLSAMYNAKRTAHVRDEKEAVLVIEREYRDDCTLGRAVMAIDGEVALECATLELPWQNNERRVSCIPEGTYVALRRHSPKYGWHWHLQDIEGRTWILIHWGNYTRDILGCILVGQEHRDIDGDGTPDVTNSRATMKALMDAHAGRRLTVEIRRAE